MCESDEYTPNERGDKGIFESVVTTSLANI